MYKKFKVRHRTSLIFGPIYATVEEGVYSVIATSEKL